MEPPFSIEQFMEVFRWYNTTVFPMQILFYVLALTALYFIAKDFSWSYKVITFVLSFCWLWMGLVYHLLFFTTINKAAYLFGIVFILESALFLYFGIRKKKLSFQFRGDAYSITGILFIFFALVIYPVIGYFSGHVYPAAPTFGLPCPTTIFTFGILLCSNKKFYLIIFLIPFAWSLLGVSAALLLGIYEDIGLLIAGIIALIMILYRNKKIERQNLIYN